MDGPPPTSNGQTDRDRAARAVGYDRRGSCGCEWDSARFADACPKHGAPGVEIPEQPGPRVPAHDEAMAQAVWMVRNQDPRAQLYLRLATVLQLQRLGDLLASLTPAAEMMLLEMTAETVPLPTADDVLDAVAGPVADAAQARPLPPGAMLDPLAQLRRRHERD